VSAKVIGQVSVILLVVLGCGGAGGDRLAGTAWDAELSGCSHVLKFTAPDTFGAGVGCTLTDGALALQATDGTYTDGDGTLTLSPTRSSCPGTTTAPVAVTYTLGATLTIQDAAGAIIYSPISPGAPTSGAVTYGCFDSAMNFTASPPIPL
jgi:hypothetical protein